MGFYRFFLLILLHCGLVSAGCDGNPDYVMVDSSQLLIADNRSPQFELGMFFRACKNAPPLFSSPSSAGAAQPVTDATHVPGAQPSSDAIHAVYDATHPVGSFTRTQQPGAQGPTPPTTGVCCWPVSAEIPTLVSPSKNGGVVVQKHCDPDELFNNGKSNSFGADVLLQDNLQDSGLTQFELQLRQFEHNLGHFNSLVESLNSSSELEPS